MASEERKLATIVVIDVVGYSAAAERDQNSAARRVTTLRARITDLAAQHGGRVFNTAGDGFLLEFPLASAAVRSAIELIEAAAAPESELPRVRAGGHLGEVIIDGDDLLGHGVNVAARLAAQAEPNALVISDAVKAQLHGEIDARFTALGALRLPKMREQVSAYVFSPGADTADWRWRARRLLRQHWRLAAVGAAALIGFVATTSLIATRPTTFVLEPIEMVAHSRRPELYPSLSPDGRFVVYMVELGESLFQDTELFMRNVEGGEETQLTDTDDFNEGIPSFSPTGDRLAYARWDASMWRREGISRCEIMVRAFPNGLDRRVAECVGSGPNRIVWTPDGQSLVFSDSPTAETGEGTSRVVIQDLESGEKRELIPMMERGMGDMGAILSYDGGRVAFVRYQNVDDADVYVYNLQRQRLTRITETSGWAQVAWADDEHLFVFKSIAGANTELWVHRSDGRGQPQRLLPGLSFLSRPSVAANTMAVQVETDTANLWRRGRGGESAITDGNQDDASADFAANGTLAYISSQTANWIYLQAPGRAAQRLVQVQDAADGLRWSPDGRRLAYSATQDGRTRIFLVDAQSGLIEEAPIESDENLGNPSWAPDGRSLVITSTSAEGPRLYRASLEGGAPTAISPPGWYEGIETTSGLFAAHRTRYGIWRLSPGRDPELVFPEYRPSVDNAIILSYREWTIADGRIYAMDHTTTGRTRILARPLSGGTMSVVEDFDQVLLGSLAIDPTNGDIVYRVPIDQQVDIGVMRFRRAG